MKISCRFEISFWSKWTIWNPYCFEFHFTSIHVNTNKELTEHRIEIFSQNEISYRFEFISLLMWTYSKVKMVLKATVQKQNFKQSLRKISSGAFVCRRSSKSMFCKNFAAEKHLCWSFFLIKMQAWSSPTLWERDSNTDVFLLILPNFWEQLFLLNTYGACFCHSYHSSMV